MRAAWLVGAVTACGAAPADDPAPDTDAPDTDVEDSAAPTVDTWDTAEVGDPYRAVPDAALPATLFAGGDAPPRRLGQLARHLLEALDAAGVVGTAEAPATASVAPLPLDGLTQPVTRGADPADQVGGLASAALDVPMGDAWATLLDPDRVCLDADAVLRHDRAFPDDPACLVDGACAARTAEDVVRLSTLLGPITFDLDVDLRSVRVPEGRGLLVRAWLPAPFRAETGTWRRTQDWRAELWVPTPTGARRVVVRWVQDGLRLDPDTAGGLLADTLTTQIAREAAHAATGTPPTCAVPRSVQP